MDPQNTTERDIAKRAYAEHQALLHQCREMIAFLDQGVFGSDKEWADQCMALFGPFFGHLRKHFSVEETGGFMTPVLEVRPTLHPQIEKLKQEHVDMIGKGCMIIERLRGAGDADWRMEDVHSHILSLLDALQKHEQTENQLLVMAFGVDIGPGD